MSTPQDCANVALGLRVGKHWDVHVSGYGGMVTVDMGWESDNMNHMYTMPRAEWVRLIREALAEEVDE
jgi:hypothetical protein